MVKQKNLLYVDPDIIHKNPDNPRIIFREDELDALMRSISQVGIQVPLSVYKKDNKYILIDGERRWRSSIKLGLSELPVIVEPEPTPLNNLLMMFNIHNVRVHWDLIATAFKIEKVRTIIKSEQGIDLSKKQLADLTGVSTSTIVSCDALLSLPEKYLEIIWKELEKPKGEQKYTEDLFIEIKKSIKTVENYLPEIVEYYTPEKILDVFFEKYHQGIENNRVRFRDISKIARGELVGIPLDRVRNTIAKYIDDLNYTIEEAYQDSVAEAYSERSAERKVQDLISILQRVDMINEGDEMKSRLLELQLLINALLN